MLGIIFIFCVCYYGIKEIQLSIRLYLKINRMSDINYKKEKLFIT